MQIPEGKQFFQRVFLGMGPRFGMVFGIIALIIGLLFLISESTRLLAFRFFFGAFLIPFLTRHLRYPYVVVSPSTVWIKPTAFHTSYVALPLTETTKKTITDRKIVIAPEGMRAVTIARWLIRKEQWDALRAAIKNPSAVDSEEPELKPVYAFRIVADEPGPECLSVIPFVAFCKFVNKNPFGLKHDVRFFSSHWIDGRGRVMEVFPQPYGAFATFIGFSEPDEQRMLEFLCKGLDSKFVHRRMRSIRTLFIEGKNMSFGDPEWIDLGTPEGGYPNMSLIMEHNPFGFSDVNFKGAWSWARQDGGMVEVVPEMNHLELYYWNVEPSVSDKVTSSIREKIIIPNDTRVSLNKSDSATHDEQFATGQSPGQVTIYRFQGIPSTRLLLDERGNVGVLKTRTSAGDEREFFFFMSKQEAFDCFQKKYKATGPERAPLPGASLKSFEVRNSFFEELGVVLTQVDGKKRFDNS